MTNEMKTAYERWGYVVTGDIIQKSDDKTDPATLKPEDNYKRI